MAANGLSGRAIAKEVGVSEFTVRQILAGCEKTPSARIYSDASESAPLAAAPLCE